MPIAQNEDGAGAEGGNGTADVSTAKSGVNPEVSIDTEVTLLR